MHVCRFRDLVTGPQPKGLFNGTSTELSLSFLTYIMGENPEGDSWDISLNVWLCNAVSSNVSCQPCAQRRW